MNSVNSKNMFLIIMLVVILGIVALYAIVSGGSDSLYMDLPIR